MASSAVMHLRIKRQAETIFMLVEPSDSFGKLIAQTAKLLGKATGDIRLIGPDKETVLPDEKLVTEAVGESTLKEDDILYLVFRKSGDTFEPIAVDDASLSGGV